MFDTLIFSTAEAEPAARTLSSLVEGVVDGMLGRVTVVADAPSDGLVKLADAAGCGLVTGLTAESWETSLGHHASTRHVMAFEAGAVLQAGWAKQLDAELRFHGKLPSGVTLAFRPDTPKARLSLIWSHSLRGRMRIRHGVVAPLATVLLPTIRAAHFKPIEGVLMLKVQVARPDSAV